MKHLINRLVCLIRGHKWEIYTNWEGKLNYCPRCGKTKEEMDMNKEQQDKLWSKLSEDDKIEQMEIYYRLKNGLSPMNKIEARGYYKGMEKVFGPHNLKPEPEPQIKEWKDVDDQTKEIIKAEAFDRSSFKEILDINIYTRYLKNSIAYKAIATIKIAKLIELGYGGMVSKEEWEDDSEEKYVITRTYKGGLQNEVSLYDWHFIAFHTPEQREEFMSYESNRILVEMYYMM